MLQSKAKSSLFPPEHLFLFEHKCHGAFQSFNSKIYLKNIHKNIYTRKHALCCSIRNVSFLATFWWKNRVPGLVPLATKLLLKNLSLYNGLLTCFCIFTVIIFFLSMNWILHTNLIHDYTLCNTCLWLPQKVESFSFPLDQNETRKWWISKVSFNTLLRLTCRESIRVKICV